MLTSPHVSGLPRGSDEFVEAFARGLAVITAFGDGDGHLTISDVARRAGLTRAGARRLLLTLVRLGFARESGGRFTLTARVLRLGFAYLSSLGLREIAQPVIAHLAQVTNEVAAVSVLDGDETVYVARAAIVTVLARYLSVGSRMPALHTSMGRVLLSGQPAAERERLLAGIERLPPYTAKTILDPARLRAELETVARQGWALVREELEIGVCGLAAPVRDASGAIVAAINISTNRSRRSPASLLRDCLPALLAAAREISGLLPPGL